MSKRKRKQRKSDPPWTDFVQAELRTTPLALKVRDLLDDHPSEVWLNSIYQAEIRYVPCPIEGVEHMTHLSVKRIDREPIGDWRVKQRIKNELLGRNVEAMELYPAEARLVDTSNQYHLWALTDGFQFPWGYLGRAVSERSFCGSKQRPWEDDQRPDDLIDDDPEELLQRIEQASD